MEDKYRDLFRRYHPFGRCGGGLAQYTQIRKVYDLYGDIITDIVTEEFAEESSRVPMPTFPIPWGGKKYVVFRGDEYLRNVCVGVLCEVQCTHETGYTREFSSRCYSCGGIEKTNKECLSRCHEHRLYPLAVAAIEKLRQIFCAIRGIEYQNQYDRYIARVKMWERINAKKRSALSKIKSATDEDFRTKMARVGK